MDQIILHAITAVISVVISVIVSAFVGEPLKKWVSGGYKQARQQKQKEMIIAYIRDARDIPSTQDIHEKFKPAKDLDGTYDLLHKIEAEGWIKALRTMDSTKETTGWMYNY